MSHLAKSSIIIASPFPIFANIFVYDVLVIFILDKHFLFIYNINIGFQILKKSILKYNKATCLSFLYFLFNFYCCLYPYFYLFDLITSIFKKIIKFVT